MKKIILFASIIGLTSIQGCKKEKNQPLSPALQTEVNLFKQNDFICDEAYIKELQYQDYNLYVFSQGQCVDAQDRILDAEGELICLEGGISGAICQDPLFKNDINGEEVLWSK
jgi:hypothetical protein